MIHPLIAKIISDAKQTMRISAFRFSLLFTLVASIITGAAMVMIYQTARQQIFDQIDARLLSESMRLQRRYEYHSSFDINPLATGITERVQTEPAMSYCLQEYPSFDEEMPVMIMTNSSFDDLCNLKRHMQSQNYLNNEEHEPLVNRKNIMRVIVMPLRNQYAVIVGYDTRSERQILHKMNTMAMLMTAVLILASFFGSFMIGQKITKSIARISRTARVIVDGDFSERILIKGNDAIELQLLAEDLNHMLDRIERLITSQRQVTNNIAHDLRSPLNRLRSRMEIALLDEHRSNAELREVISQSIVDAQGLLQTFNSLLNIAQVESRARDDFELISLSQISEDMAEMYEVLNEEEEGMHHFCAQIDADLMIMGNRQLTAQAITNLLDNAVKYTPEGGHIFLQALRREHTVVVAVCDDGKGIAEQDREKVLKRFVRLDAARSTQGNGLGLSLVAAIMSLHGGTIQLLENKPTGLRIELSFPDPEAFKSRYHNAA